jgi:4-hydroxybenzoate polyprenyltransferase
MTILLIIATVIFIVTCLFAWVLCAIAKDVYDYEADEPEPPPRVTTRIWSKDIKTGEWK